MIQILINMDNLINKDQNTQKLTLNFLNSLFCCLLRILGFVSKLCGLFRFFAEAIAAAAATPTGPMKYHFFLLVFK